MRRASKRWSTPFGSFVSRFTVSGIKAQLMGQGFPITEKAVYNWMAGLALPTLPVADALVRISGGSITVTDIVQHRGEARSSGGSGGEGAGTG